jgi:hypothetical protein
MEYLYDERAPKGWPVAAVTFYLGAVAWAGAVTLPHDLGAWLAVAAMLLLLLVACLAVTLSRSVHHRIQLSPETLRVGWERIPVDQLDPATIGDLPTGATAPGEPRLVGGAAGVPAGMDRVVVRARSGEPLCIATRDRTALLAALQQATGGGRPPALGVDACRRSPTRIHAGSAWGRAVSRRIPRSTATGWRRSG